MVSDILIEDFANTLYSWKTVGPAEKEEEEEEPTSTEGWKIEHGVGILEEGRCSSTPAQEEEFVSPVDISSCQGLMLKVKSTGQSSLSSMRVSFANLSHLTDGDGFYMADWQAAEEESSFGNDNEWTQIMIPFSEFTANVRQMENDGVMETSTTCAQDATLCPTTESLQHVEQFVICARQEQLEIAAIYGAACTDEAAVTERREEIYVSNGTAQGSSASFWIMGATAGGLVLLAVLLVVRKKMGLRHYSAVNHRDDQEHHDDTELTLQVWNQEAKLEMEELEWLEDNA